jgi:hypothetical protein
LTPTIGYDIGVVLIVRVLSDIHTRTSHDNVKIDHTLVGIIANLKVVDDDILMRDTLIVVVLFNDGLVMNSDKVNVLTVECGFE